MGYLHDRNSVEERTFELTKALPRTQPLSHTDCDDLALVRRLINEHPKETLNQLCERVQTEYHLTTSHSTLSRALKCLGLSRRKRTSHRTRREGRKTRSCLVRHQGFQSRMWEWGLYV